MWETLVTLAHTLHFYPEHDVVQVINDVWVPLSLFLLEIPGFLSEEECGVVVQLAQLKGLMESQATVPPEDQEEELQPLRSLSPEETFSLLDLDQDGLLQRQEVRERGMREGEVGW